MTPREHGSTWPLGPTTMPMTGIRSSLDGGHCQIMARPNGGSWLTAALIDHEATRRVDRRFRNPRTGTLSACGNKSYRRESRPNDIDPTSSLWQSLRASRTSIGRCSIAPASIDVQQSVCRIPINTRWNMDRCASIPNAKGGRKTTLSRCN